MDLFGPSAALHRYLGRNYPPADGSPSELDATRGFALPVPAFSECLPCLHDEWVAVSLRVTRGGRSASRTPSERTAPGWGRRRASWRGGWARLSLQREAQQLETLLRGLGT